MSKKIEGRVTSMWGKYAFLDDASAPNQWPPATLVIHEGPPEKVFTESELKAYVKDMFKAQFDPGAFAPRYLEDHPLGSYEETVPQWITRVKAIVSKNHGITL